MANIYSNSSEHHILSVCNIRCRVRSRFVVHRKYNAVLHAPPHTPIGLGLLSGCNIRYTGSGRVFWLMPKVSCRPPHLHTHPSALPYLPFSVFLIPTPTRLPVLYLRLGLTLYSPGGGCGGGRGSSSSSSISSSSGGDSTQPVNPSISITPHPPVLREGE